MTLCTPSAFTTPNTGMGIHRHAFPTATCVDDTKDTPAPTTIYRMHSWCCIWYAKWAWDVYVGAVHVLHVSKLRAGCGTSC